MKKWLIALGIASGWIATLLVGILDLPAKINSFSDQLPKAVSSVKDAALLNKDFTGTWSSDIEGWMDVTDDERRLQGGERAPVALRMRVYAGEMEGEISSTAIAKQYVYSALLLKGQKKGDGIDVIVYDYIEGKPETFALLRITRATDTRAEALQVKLVDQGPKYFPDDVRLYRDEKAMDHAGRIYFDAVMKALGRKPGTGKHRLQE